MLTEERHNYILNKLKKQSTVKLKELEKEMDCSESTVRRDLSELEDQGLLIRIHGGAKRVYTVDSEMGMKEKSIKNVHEKEMIGRFAASFVETDDIIYLDAGTTTYAMISFLTNIDNLLVVTNGVTHAHLLTEYGISSILIGGKIKEKTKAIIGSVSLQQLSGYRFNKAFLGINGINVDFGYTTSDTEEAALKKMAGNNANKTYVLADHTKFHKINFAKVSELEDYVIITDKLEDDDRKQFSKWAKIWEVNK